MSLFFIRDVGIVSLAEAIAGFAAFTYTIITARLLGVADFGLFQSLLAIYYVCSLFSLPLRLSTAHGVGTCQPDAIRKVTGEFIKVSFLGGAALTVIIWFFSPHLVEVVKSHHIYSVLIMGVLLTSRALSITIYGSLQGQNLHSHFAKSRIVESFTCLAVGSLLVYFGLGPAGALLGYLGGMLVIIIYFLGREKIADLQPGFSYVGNEFRSIGLIVVSMGLFLAIDNVPVIVGRSILSHDDSGFFGAIYNLRQILLPFGIAIAIPFYTHSLKAERESNLLQKAMLLTSGLGLGFIFVGQVCPKFIIRLIYGDVFVPAADHFSHYGISLWIQLIVLVLIFYKISARRLNGWSLLVPMTILIIVMATSAHSITALINGQILAWLGYLLALLTFKPASSSN